MKIAIAGYGELGRAVEKASLARDEFELYGVFTRRNPQKIRAVAGTEIYPFCEIISHKNEIDVVLNCMGSAFDLPAVTPYLARYFNQVDSFDTHKNVKAHLEKTAASAEKGGKLTAICVGWDPGLFSLARLYMNAAIPEGKDYTFWGEGVSRGHTNAIKQLENVVDAVQYTVPVNSAVISVRKGDMPELNDRQMHKRVCYVVPQPGADTEKIASEIKSMPNYFDGYETEVHFIDYESFLCDHSGESHGGSVIRCSKGSLAEFTLKLQSNTAFTADIMLSYAAAVYRLNKRGKTGAVTVFDIAPCELLGGDSASLLSLI